MAITASFLAKTGQLSVFGDNLDNTITESRDAAGNILINGGAVTVIGGKPTVANTTLTQIFGQGGNDTITLNEASGALPAAQLFGGAGNDVLTGGSGNDQMFGEAGNDRMIWNPGDDNDLMEGGAGTDTAEVNGGNGSEVFTATANGARVRFDRLDPAPFFLDIGTTENLVLNMNGGDDRFSATGNLSALINLTIDGGAGNDTILGGNGNDKLLGGDGNDFIDGNQGNDTILLGAGDDVMQWDPGDGSDTVEGQDGSDRMLFNGSAAAESFAVSANGARVMFTRNVGNITMDLNGIEKIDVNALGGADTITVNDLSGTGVTEMNVNLAGAIGGSAGDAAADTVTVNGTAGNDIIDVFGAGTSVSVLGLPAQVNITNAEGANDSLVIKGGAGDDGITATTLPAGVMKLTLDGGAGDDTILGSQGDDKILGGDGDDFVIGGRGNDVVQMGAGDDALQWNPGDGSDTVDGGDGTDLMLFFGANVSENINIVANGGHALFTRDVASVTMDLDNVEHIEFRALGGADNVTVGDLSGTDVNRVEIDLRGSSGGGDGAADTVTVNATNGADVFGVAGDAGGLHVFGLQADVNIFFQEQANDHLTLNGNGGSDVIDARSLEADGIQLTMNGGLGNDTFYGSEGDDLVNGGDGSDAAFMGAGNDTFVWNPGDDNDTVEGQDGFDTMAFNGANIAEKITISANGERAMFTRDVANVSMDLNGVESIDFKALGGADMITVNDMSGTDVQQVNINLAGSNGLGDGAADTIVINATSGDDVVIVAGDNGGVSVLGLTAQINITGFEANLDKIVINTLAGDDVIEASGLAPGTIQLTGNGGDGDDVLIGSPGNDELHGEAGDDVLIGNGGQDVLDGGPGDNVVIASFAVARTAMTFDHDLMV